MSKETRLQVLLHGIRWASNILVEILANHAKAVDANSTGVDSLRVAISALAEAETAFVTSLDVR